MRKPCILTFLLHLSLRFAAASGHGPVFALATPTNPQGIANLDIGFMDRQGASGGSPMMRALLGYGLTENLQLDISAPAVFENQPLAPSRFTGFMPMGGDLESILHWRFLRRDTGVGSRVESTLSGGAIIPGPQPTFEGLRRAPGAYMALVTGVASRAHYVWGGVSYSRFAAAHGDRRPDVVFYSFAYGYRPRSWRTDYPRWDWRVFGELTGERAGAVRRATADLPGSRTQQVFLGPTTLGTYKNYAVSAGVLFPVYRDVYLNAGRIYERERLRIAVNVTYYFSFRRNEP